METQHHFRADPTWGRLYLTEGKIIPDRQNNPGVRYYWQFFGRVLEVLGFAKRIEVDHTPFYVNRKSLIKFFERVTDKQIYTKQYPHTFRIAAIGRIFDQSVQKTTQFDQIYSDVVNKMSPKEIRKKCVIGIEDASELINKEAQGRLVRIYLCGDELIVKQAKKKLAVLQPEWLVESLILGYNLQEKSAPVSKMLEPISKSDHCVAFCMVRNSSGSNWYRHDDNVNGRQIAISQFMDTHFGSDKTFLCVVPPKNLLSFWHKGKAGDLYSPSDTAIQCTRYRSPEEVNSGQEMAICWHTLGIEE